MAERALNQAARYYLAAVALLVVLVAAHATITVRRTQAELTAALERNAGSVAAALESASRLAIRSNALLETAISRRLFDNARLVDELNRQHPLDGAALARLAARNGLRRIDLLDMDGRPWSPPPPEPPRMRMMHGRRWATPATAPPGDSRPEPPEPPMMRYFFGPRWARPPVADGDVAAPAAIQDRKFWEGSLFGVGIGARSFPGMIAVHADAEFVRQFRAEIGVDRQVAELTRAAGATSLAVLDPDLVVLAHSDPSQVGQRLEDAELRRVVGERGMRSRLVETGGSASVEIARPLVLDGPVSGVLLARFDAGGLARARRDHVRGALALGAAILAVGAAGFAALFYVQQRHLRERVRLEAELARRDRLAAVGDLAAAFAHEVRNPLNAVSMGLQRLRVEWAPEPRADYARFVTLLEEEVRRLNGIVDRFIALARPVSLTPGAVDVGTLLTELRDLLATQAAGAGVEVRVVIEGDRRPVSADRDALKQVLLNLALNALAAMPDGGVLTLEAAVTRRRATLTVTDTGRGIAPEVLPRIFDPYFTTRSDGLGLGLTVARRIVDAHAGTIEATSSPGRGARFRVVLPS